MAVLGGGAVSYERGTPVEEGEELRETPPEREFDLRFRGGLVFKAHRLVYHSTLGLGVIKKKKKKLRVLI